MIEGIIQQRRIYSLTGKTGDGKTALQLYLAYLIATATMLGEREVERGRVLYLAGENPDDVRARWIAMSDALGFDVDTVDVHFVEGVFSVSGLLDRVTAETEAIGDSQPSLSIPLPRTSRAMPKTTTCNWETMPACFAS
jgi:RecA-family ATPase